MRQDQPPDKQALSSIELLVRQRLVIVSCKKLIQQLKDKGIGLTFAERTACNLVLDSIERLGY